ncbi:MAG: hypothetical protein PVF81_03600 [Thioalkalispiraceae bacterium]
MLSACQGSGVYTNPVPAYVEIKPGSTLTLNSELTIPANLARVYLQGAQVVPEKGVNRYYPNCSLEVRTLKNTPQKISADTFTIVRVKSDEEVASRKLHYASRFFSSDDGPISHENWVTHFYLHSARQPDVYRLSCAHWEDPPEARHLLMPEIITTVGSYFSFNY